MQQTYDVYFMASHTKVLYTGVTNNLELRVEQHRAATDITFTGRYNVHRLVYYEDYPYIPDAIAREKQIKGWLRRKKIALIEGRNPRWIDLSFEWREGSVHRKERRSCGWRLRMTAGSRRSPA